jgi:Cu+-exporting ATPase
VKAAAERELDLTEPENFKAVSGSGVRGTTGGREIIIGKPRWFEEQGVSLNSALPDINRLEDKGKTVMAVFAEGKLAGLIAVADTLHPDSNPAIHSLKRQGLQVIMLTGDNRRTAGAIAAQAGIEDIFAEVLPEEKSAKVKELRNQGKKVGMVGDGINDAPALAQADVGMAIGRGTDIAIEAADVILSADTLAGVPKAIALSRATMKTIRQNLFWAFFYNIILIPVAAGALHPFEALPEFLRQLHPILAALAMSMSSITVVSNSLRLYKS